MLCCNESSKKEKSNKVPTRGIRRLEKDLFTCITAKTLVKTIANLAVVVTKIEAMTGGRFTKRTER